MNSSTWKSRRLGSTLALGLIISGAGLLTGCNTAPGDPGKNPYSGAPAGAGAPAAPGQPPASANYQDRSGPGGPGG